MANVPTNMGPPMETGPMPADPAISKITTASYVGTGTGINPVGTIGVGTPGSAPVQNQPAQLRFYIQSGQLYALDNVTGNAYAIGPALQVPQPPIYSPTR